MAIHQNTAFRIKERERFQADWVVRQCESGKEFRLQRRLTSRDYQWISHILSFHIDGVRSLTENKPWWVGQWWDIETYRDSVDLCRTALCGFSCFHPALRSLHTLSDLRQRPLQHDPGVARCRPTWTAAATGMKRLKSWLDSKKEPLSFKELLCFINFISWEPLRLLSHNTLLGCTRFHTFWTWNSR
jgi:hypothetical protein